MKLFRDYCLGKEGVVYITVTEIFYYSTSRMFSILVNFQPTNLSLELFNSCLLSYIIIQEKGNLEQAASHQPHDDDVRS